MRTNCISPLYRGKSTQTNNWIFGNLIERAGKFYIGYEKNPNNALEAIFVTEDVHAESVGQYSGVHAEWTSLETNNLVGMLIFSGDILELEHEGKVMTAQVLCENGSFLLVFPELENKAVTLYDKVRSCWTENLVGNSVIPATPKGNTFENPITLSTAR